MAPQDILKKLNRQPFQPFRMHVSDGVSYDVNYVGQASVILTEVYVGVDPDDSGLPTRSVYIAPNHVTRIEPIQPVTPPKE